MDGVAWTSGAAGWLTAGCALAVAAARLGWLRRGGHRIEEDFEAEPTPTDARGEADGIPRVPPAPATPRAVWLLPTVAILGYAVGAGRAGEGTPLLVVVAMGVVVGLLGILSVIDLDVHRLPNSFTYPMGGGVAALLTVVAVATGDWLSWRRALIAGIVLGLVYLVLVLVGRGTGMGLGDAKLAPTLGMLLGWLSWGSVLLATMLTFLLGGVVAGALLVARRATGKTAIPFGPAMALGAVLVWALPAVVVL